MRLGAQTIRQATVAQIDAALRQRGGAGRSVLALLEQDARIGVRRLAVRERARRRQREAEGRRARRIRDLEERFRAEGYVRLAGVDEVGRGCLAGPVVAAAVILPADAPGLEALDDSKVLDAATRQELRERIVDAALAWSVAAIEAEEIDRINILEASMKAMRQAVAGLRPPPQRVLVDGNRGPGTGLPETLLVDGDARSLSIAAASVVAKVHRDALLVELDGRYPGYGFARNKGYGSAAHRRALEALGPCPLHRRSFAPVAPAQLSLPLDEVAPGTGRRGEDVAAQHLLTRGYRIEARGWRAAGGEIDLVAGDGDCTVFVEVKTTMRPGARPEGRVDGRKRQHLRRAARAWSRRAAAAEYRFDVVAVDLSADPPRIQHLVDAFTLDDG
jgi:ribonuclease HII